MKRTILFIGQGRDGFERYQYYGDWNKAEIVLNTPPWEDDLVLKGEVEVICWPFFFEYYTINEDFD